MDHRHLSSWRRNSEDPQFLQEPRHFRAFTLVELMAALAVTAILVALLGAVFGSVSQSFRYGLGLIDNQTRARLALDVITRDLQSGAFLGTNLSAFKNESTDALAFYSGIASLGNDRGISAITYFQPNNNQYSVGSGAKKQYGVLCRGSYGVSWSNSTTTMPFNSTSTTVPLMPPDVAIGSRSDSSTVAEGILSFKYAFVNLVTETNSTSGALTQSVVLSQTYDYKDEVITTPYAGTKVTRPKYVRISFAVMSERGVKQLGEKFQDAANQLDLSPADQSSNLSLIPLWQSKANQPALNNLLPPEARTGLKFYERFIALPSS